MKILFVLLLCFVAQASQAEDGDTIWRDGRKIRLWGVDAPEKDQPYGQEARLALAAMRSDMVATEHRGWSYDREVVLVDLRNGSNVQIELLRLGLVWVDPRYCKSVFPCAAWKFAEGNAKERRLGIWSEDDPTPPWEWRRMKKERKQ